MQPAKDEPKTMLGPGPLSMKPYLCVNSNMKNKISLILTCLASCLLSYSTANSVRASDDAFTQLADEIWDYRLQQNPLLATSTGDHRYNDRLPNVGVEQSQQNAANLSKYLQALDALPTGSLSPANQINHAILRRVLKNEVDEANHKAYLIPITNRSGFHISFPDLAKRMPLETEADYLNYLARLNRFHEYADQHIKIMRKGLAEGYSLPSVVLSRYADPIKTHMVDDAKESVFYEPFKTLPESFSPETRDRLQQAAREAIQESIVPGYSAYFEFMRDEYVPNARGSIGASALPNGREFYRHRVHRFTTLDLTPAEVHEIGLAEVKRIRDEMEEVKREAGFEGSLNAFMDFLREDPQFKPKTAAELMEKTALILKRIDGQLPKLFNTLPRTPYGLREIPAYIAPQTTAAYYMPPPGDGSRAGFYYLNTYDLKSRPLYNLEALSLHEAVPGHHLQIALQQELSDLPPYRRFAMFTAFVEGWALYAERLGLEVGFYQDPYNNFGRLTYEMWRACRLVVDTGIHYLGWTREQAIEFMANNSALSLHNIRSEVDRYIAWPGQALGYKIGEIKIRELRRQAAEELQDSFNVRDFHAAVLTQGSVPLDVLTQQVETWIANVKAGTSATP